MTQIVTCITEDAVVVVADRRLTDLRTGEVVDNESCKLILIETQAAIAYTGLANVKPPPRGQTDLWILDTLTPPPPTLPAFTSLLGHAAYEQFSKISHLGPRAKRHVFVMAGWERADAKSPFVPFISTISNAERDDGGWEERASRQFVLRTRRLKRDFELRVAGHPLTAFDETQLLADLRDPANRELAKVGSLLANAVRATSSKNPAVGQTLLVAVLPRPDEACSGVPVSVVEVPENARVVLPEIASAQTFYVSNRGGEAKLYAPHVITRDLSLGDVRVYDRALSPEEIKRKYEEGKKRFQ
jgi:hypothetical protein